MSIFNSRYGCHPKHWHPRTNEEIPLAFGEGDVVYIENSTPTKYFRICSAFHCKIHSDYVLPEQQPNQTYRNWVDNNKKIIDEADDLLLNSITDISKLPFDAYYKVCDYNPETKKSGEEDWSDRIHTVEIDSKIISCRSSDPEVEIEYKPQNWRLYFKAGDTNDPEKDEFIETERIEKAQWEKRLSKMTKVVKECTTPDGKKFTYVQYK